ncbi:MAG: YlxM family DNA-binding protein [Limnochordia bacterium]|jgi:predicted DNA-binding protein YlxM (UPF0122 family)|nr:YlxM family DNA-binding protein [Bacillota bacterium]
MDAPAKTVQMNLLFDLYGQLLTDRQREIFILYYHDDLSLGEIAENIQISRQGVYDTLQRVEQALLDLERSLGLLAKDQRRNQTLRTLEGLLREMREHVEHTQVRDEVLLRCLKEAMDAVEELMTE